MSFLLYGLNGMGWVDLVPRAGKLYIGGLYALYQTDLIKAAGITHVLSVIDYDPLLQEKFHHLKHYHIRAEDDPNEDLLQHFKGTNEYIDEGLKDGGVFIHCAMGKSRSATMVVAYLMWKYGRTWEEALEQLCEGRPVCDPNIGFKEQSVYQEWLKERFKGEWWEWDARAKGLKANL
ncbi:tyrosine protein phosphatase 3 [Melanomma pulvis-pyrius CBS 109.77]|uniref:Tyrosine protein phosphatase 3 n=1 Tax=Melanomma pulvis-pyrius CBS 109.77 TaxID=1314802 RepID=A0A6A6WZQ2_9PLEO|nr:tyrosine protein phosphatase 3 [Melanomma pulvis-pyrius CBS 109.77]